MSAIEYSIGDVAKKLNLPVHTIRFWTETFEHIEITRRNGRRYYDEKAVEELQKIKDLSRKKGLKIEGIQKMIKYNKINMEKMNDANKLALKQALESAIKITDRIIESIKSW